MKSNDRNEADSPRLVLNQNELVMKKEVFTYVLLIPKSKWACIESAEIIPENLNTVDELREYVPNGTTIMPMYEFFRFINKGAINTDTNWVVPAYVEQTIEEYYKLEAR